MYKISVPIMNSSLNEKTRHMYLEQMKRACVDRVFIVVVEFCKTEEEEYALISSLRENIEYFDKNGIEAFVWVGTTIGHGVVLAGVNEQRFFSDSVRMVTLDGESLFDTRCPLYPEVREKLAHHLSVVARSGAKTILIDDDFRSSHGASPCCACDKHIQLMSEMCGENLVREELWNKCFCMPANKYRKAWISAQGEGLRLLALDMRRAVDNIDPSIRIALCSCPSLWGADSPDALELVKILAGKQKPLLRLFNAPYISILGNRSLSSIFERSRMIAEFAYGSEIELMAEGDVYPRPRYNIPSSHLELFDAVMRTDSKYDGILKYMVDYTASCDYELGYIDRHTENLTLMSQIEKLFDNKRSCGVRVYEYPYLFSSADMSKSSNSRYMPYSSSGTMMSEASIPTIYDGDGICGTVFGDAARKIELKDIEKGAVLDAISAMILQERGVDIGMFEAADMRSGVASYQLLPDHSEKAYIMNGEIRYITPRLKDFAQVVESFEVDGKEYPMAYRYENALGQRFLVYLFDALFNVRSTVARGYLNQRILTEHVEWISRQSLPAKCMGNPDLYMLCKKDENGRMAIGLFNCSADSILHPVIKLDREYSGISFVNTSGTLKGDAVELNEALHAFTFAAIEVFDN